MDHKGLTYQFTFAVLSGANLCALEASRSLALCSGDRVLFLGAVEVR